MMKTFLRNLLTLSLLGLFGWLAVEHRAAASLVVAFSFCWILQMLLRVKLSRLASFLPLGPVLMTVAMARLSTWWAAALASIAGYAVGLLWVWFRKRRELQALAADGLHPWMVADRPVDLLFRGLDPLTRTPNPFVIQGRRFRPGEHRLTSKLRAWFYAALIRVALLVGLRVLVVGPAGCGKTFVLARAFRGRVLDGAAQFHRHGGSTSLDVSQIPSAPFAIEELPGFEVDQLDAAIPALRDRIFAMSLQSLSHVKLLGLEPLFAGRRTLVVALNITR